MPLTDVERFLFRGQNLAHWVTAFNFDGKQVEVSLAPMRDDDAPLKPFKAVFANAVILSIEEDSERRDTWPLDIIGFDSYEAETLEVCPELWKCRVGMGV